MKFSLLFLLFTFGAMAKVSLNGAGATFPNPIYTQWISEFQKTNSNIQINYQAIGSGGGVRQLLAETVDFGGSDVPMKAAQEKKSSHKILHIPTILGGVTLAYNLPNFSGQIRMDGPTLSRIFLGEITNWSDKALRDLNPKLALPNKSILVVHRSDSSGTSAIFTEYLSRVSPKWNKKVGKGKAVQFPQGIGAKGNDGITGVVKRTPGALGYIELAYAVNNKLPVMALKNKQGHFIAPSPESISAAAIPWSQAQDYRVSLVDPDQAEAYPISSWTYLLLPLSKHNDSKRAALKDFLKWSLTKGQDYAETLHYAPLPKALRERVINELTRI